MPWTKITRPDYDRRHGRYASDLTDREWSLVAGFMPERRRTGRPRTTELRDVMDAILYIASTGCQWRMLPNDFPPASTVRRYFYDWRDSGLLQTINHHLVMAARELEGKEVSPSAGVIDSQSVKTTESGGILQVAQAGLQLHMFLDQSVQNGRYTHKCLRDTRRL